ncbi:MAG: hypothetical protein KME45_09900 [Stenomitos rutilans HA7619-LM2]|nr:hypothetical protein [Stenomitos rutilans HA7619-LM2]
MLPTNCDITIGCKALTSTISQQALRSVQLILLCKLFATTGWWAAVSYQRSAISGSSNNQLLFLNAQRAIQPTTALAVSLEFKAER